MQDKKNTPPDEEPIDPERRSSPLQPQPRHTAPPGEPETISLLDLMGAPDAATPPAPSAPPEAKTTELPPLSVDMSSGPTSAPGDTQATPTATIRPPGGQSPASPGRTERPLA
ncbi:MAG: hypothetical protein K1X50_10930, partial [Candidatus Promineofilum sp.]|nr:hypothetical protein [Promineifilum sp.]